MLPWLLPALGGALSLIGIDASSRGQRETNASNETIARETNQLNVAEAEKNRQFQAEQTSAQMKFQSDMAGSVHQREVADYKKAGLNPILAATGGAPAPGGAAAGGSQATGTSARLDNPSAAYAQLGSVLGNAMDVQKNLGEINLQGQQVSNMQTQNELNKAQIKKLGVDTKVAEKGIPASDIANKLYTKGLSYVERLYQRFVDGTASYESYKRAKQRQDEFDSRKTLP